MNIGIVPEGVAVTPDGTKVYVPNGINNVSVIDTATNTVSANVSVGPVPAAFGQFIQRKTVPKITWSTPDNITYKTALSRTQLDATASVNGTFIYTPPAGTLLSIGTQKLNVSFTPTDTANYANTSANVSINITGVIPTIIWNNPANIVYGTPLSGIQLNAIAATGHTIPIYSIPGTYMYSPSAGTILSVGKQALLVYFTPTNGMPGMNTTYTTATKIVSINVLNTTRITPKITWSNPANRIYGTALNSTQLDASTSVPGTFVYTPTSGTKLSVGMHTLNTTFTPTDIANYTTASASVLINVTPGTPITVGSILGVGTHILTATFTPTDTITYTPTLTWTPNPLASIVYGTPLSITQLDATAAYNRQTVPGNFVYTDPIGTAETSGSGGIIQNSITVTPNVQNAALTIQKSAYPTSYDDVGQIIRYTYNVTNSGNVGISAPITVTDEKVGTVSIQNSGILSPSSSVTGTATYKITDADINTGSVTNAAYAKGSFNNNPISSPLTVALVHYKQPAKKEEHNGDRDNYGGPGYGGYGGAVIPMISGPMYGSPMFSGEPNGYISGPSTTETLNSESNVHKAKAHLSKHKHEHKHHTTKHHKTGKNT